jgi:large conductance mechanosensitive channel
MLKEFRNFILKGNVLDLAVAFILGTAFGRVVSSLVNDIIMPPIGKALGNVNFTDMFINLSGGSYKSLADAQAAGAATINYGNFINFVIDFILVGLALFFVIKAFNASRRPAPAAAPTTKECPFCHTDIPIAATRCPNCTSQLGA